MADVRIHSNTSLQSNLLANPHVQKQSPGFWGKTKEVASGVFHRICNRPVLKHALPKATDPKQVLEKINDDAEDGLQRAAAANVKLEPVGAHLQLNLDRLLSDLKSAKTQAVNARAASPVAENPPFNNAPFVTRAPDLQARVKATDWPDEMESKRKDLTKKLSAFTALLEMRNRCGIKEPDNLGIMNLAKRAAEGAKPPSVWELFTGKFKLSLIQKIKAAWFYWIYYQTALISNTVNEYVKSFIENMTNDLTLPNNNTRSLVFRKLLENANQFLVGDIQATKDFSEGKEHGDLKDYRDRAIERHYGFSLDELCKAFSEKQVKPDFIVPLFGTLRDIPILGALFKGLERLINRHIIQSYMKSGTLPKALKLAVENGLEATQPHNLPFALSLTRFFTSQLEQLKKELNKGGLNTAKPKGAFPGTELLSAVVKNLNKALDLEPLHTSDELKKKFIEMEAGKWIWNKKTQEGIEQGILEAGNLLFNYLNDAAKSSELFARALGLAADAFSVEARDAELLMAEYKEEQAKLERVAGEISGKIIELTVQKIFDGGDKPKDPGQVAKDSFISRQLVANKALDELHGLSGRMSKNIELSAQSPTSPEYNVQTDIGSFLQIMQVFANRQEVQDVLKDLDPVDRDPIWRILTPLYERAAKIQKRVLKLQDLQHHYPTHAVIEMNLRSIQDLLKSIRDQFHAQPRHYQNPFNQTLGKHTDEIIKRLGPKADESVKLQGFMIQIAELSDSIAKEQKVIEAIYAFYPPRNEGDEVEQEGLLDQLLNYERGIHPPGFRPKNCLSEIRKYLEHFPKEERKELEILIGNGSNITAKWERLANVLQRIYQKHVNLKNQDKLLLDETLDIASEMTRNYALGYASRKERDHAEMKKEIGVILTEVKALREDTEKAKLNFPGSLSPEATQIGQALVAGVIGGAAGASLALGGGLIGSIFGPIGTVVGSGVGAAISATAYTSSQNFSKLLKGDGEHVAKSVTMMGVGGAATCLIPGVGVGALGGALAASHYKGVIHAYGNDIVVPRVKEIFKNAYKFVLASRIYKAASTRAIKALS